MQDEDEISSKISDMCLCLGMDESVDLFHGDWI